MTGISGKVVAIAGASSGIGETTAIHLAERGASIVLAGRRADRLDTLVSRIQDLEGTAVAVPTDIRSPEDMHRLVDVAVTTFGRLDVLFLNAGNMAVSPLDDLLVNDWDEMVDVNVKGALNGIAAALPVFREQKSGHFIHTASTVANRASSGMTVYAATKAAVRVIADGLRQEVSPEIRVTLITPGLTDTEGVGKGGSTQMAATLLSQRDAIGMPPESVAAAVAFAIEQPDAVDIGEIVLRATAQR